MEPIRIDSLDDPRLAVYTRLTGRQLRSRQSPGDGLLIAESPKVILHALDAGYEPVSLLASERHLSGTAAPILARCPELPVFTGTEETLAGLTGIELTRGVLCAMKRKPLPDPAELCRSARRVAVLEGIVDPTNVGALFRGAACLGMDAVLVTPTCCDPLHRRSVRVSMGTVFQVPWTRIGSAPGDWPEKGLAFLKDMGFATAAMSLSGDPVMIGDPRLQAEEKLAVVLGTEGDGLAGETIARCDYNVYIPMSHGTDSLNVAAAGAVAFWVLGNRG